MPASLSDLGMISLLPSSAKDTGQGIALGDRRLTVHRRDPLPYWDAIDDADSGLYMAVLGRVVPETDAWPAIGRRPGSVTRDLLRKWKILEPIEFARTLNGAYTLFIADRQRHRITVITDRLGIRPVYVHTMEDGRRVRLCTHPIMLANSVSASMDMDSLAEFLQEGHIFHPHTLFAGVSGLEEGSIYCWNLDNPGVKHQRYYSFSPRYGETKAQLIDALSEAISDAVARRTVDEYGKVGVFLSGGADSRVIACRAKRAVSGITLYDVENREFQTARAIAEHLGIEHIQIHRGIEYYVRAQESSALTTGGGSSFTHDHFLNVADNPQVTSFNSILSGCYADWMFKGIAYNRRHSTIAGKKTPWMRLAPYQHHFFGAYVPITDKWQRVVSDRCAAAMASIDTRDAARVGHRRIVPLAQEETAAARLSLQRLMPWDPVMADNAIIDVYERTPPELICNAQVYEPAVGRLCSEVDHIRHSAKGTRLNRQAWMNVPRRSWEVLKAKSLPAKGDDLFGQGSWLHQDTFVRKAPGLRERWKTVPSELKEIVEDILGSDPWEIPYEALASRNRHLICHVLTLAPLF